MTKYEPLKRYLAQARGTSIPMSFRQIEEILGFDLPSSARQYPAWWSNSVGTHVNAAAWRSAGWRTSAVDIGGERVTFLRDDRPAGPAPVRRPLAGGTTPEAAGMAEAGAAFDAIVLPPSRLSRSALGMIDDLAEAQHGDRVAAVVAILEANATERRRRMLEDLSVARLPADHDSTGLIRDDRDRC